jgi:hypothetical protein
VQYSSHLNTVVRKQKERISLPSCLKDYLHILANKVMNTINPTRAKID